MKFILSYILLSLAALNFCIASPIRSRDASVEFSILSPKEGDVYFFGDNVSIVWVNDYKTLCNINIVEDNTSVPIASNVEANQDQYLWTIPQNLSSSTQGSYRIQIVYRNDTITSGKFTIKNADAILSNDNSSANNAGAINKDPMSGAKATASITIIGSENKHESLATIHLPGYYTLGALFTTFIVMSFL